MNDNDLRSLLVVEDNPSLQKQLKWAFDEYHVYMAGDRKSAISQLIQYRPHVVTLDLGLPPDTANASEGLSLLAEILELAPYTKVIVVTGNDERDVALKAISLGAYDFYQKPVDPGVLALIVDRASNVYELEAENRELQSRLFKGSLEGIIFSSDVMLDVSRMVERVGPSDATVLITGESGTGKELIARALHESSARKDGPFVALNCAAIPENLLESELFGHEKGAFTGADRKVKGKIESASGGTFFLDEIGDMPVPLQAKMLRFLQERTVDRLGGREPVAVDVRVICATHRNLKEFIVDGHFRDDLYYRVGEIVVHVPPLREREGDRILLAKALLDKYAGMSRRKIYGFTESALQQIDEYKWPGNVRELENKVKRAVILAEGNRITAQDLGFGHQKEPVMTDLRHAREAAERKVIQQALLVHANNMSHAAEALGISRPSLYNLMRKLDIDVAGK